MDPLRYCSMCFQLVFIIQKYSAKQPLFDYLKAADLIPLILAMSIRESYYTKKCANMKLCLAKLCHKAIRNRTVSIDFNDFLIPKYF